MKQLKHVPEGKAIPKSRPFVYFLAHEKDFPLYFSDIARQLMKAAKCVIFYDNGEGEDCDEETRLYDIRQMRLAVIPVTSRLLSEPDSRAMREAAYAIEKGIPLLPILQEPGIEGEFNRIFGNMQMLSVLPGDGTEISYEEKLKKYLCAALIGDELAERVRAAFDAYIFLSYRKKDRKYADELMRLIHKNEFCRDVAIWYDEFLTPGEDFNDEIADALDKSRLFALAVTPNLVKESNYVMEVEYKLAKKSEKPILPAELVPTDRGALEQYFDGIPTTVDPYDPPALSETLTQMLQNIAIRENDKDSEHNFFIGLAYLSGIDVEVDKRRAVRLITESAEAGLPEAISKLIDLYNLSGVLRHNPEKIRIWRIRLAEILHKELSENPSAENYRRLIDAMCELGGDHELSYEERVRVCERNLEFAGELLEKYPDEWHERYLASVYGALAEAYTRAGRFEDALGAYKEMIAINERLARRYTEQMYRRNLARDYYDLAHFYFMHYKDTHAPVETVKLSAEIYESLCSEERSDENLNGLCDVCGLSAKIYKRFFSYNESDTEARQTAEKHLLRVLDIRKKQLDAFESLENIGNLYTAHYELYQFYRNGSLPDKAIEHMLERIRLSRRKYEINGYLSYLSYLNEDIQDLVKYYVELGRFNEAQKWGDELIENAKKYTYEPYSYWNSVPGHALIHAYSLNGEIYEGLGDWQRELWHRKNAVMVSEENAVRYHVSHLTATYFEYTGLSRRFYERGMYGEAEDCARRGFSCAFRITKEDSIFSGHQVMKYAVEDLIYILEQIGKPDEAAKYYPCRDIYNAAYSDNTENAEHFVRLGRMYLEYAETRDADERKGWRLNVLKLLHIMGDVIKSHSGFEELYDTLRAEFPDEKLGFGREEPEDEFIN